MNDIYDRNNNGRRLKELDKEKLSESTKYSHLFCFFFAANVSDQYIYFFSILKDKT